MRSWLRVGLVATLTLSTVYGCDENENEGPAPQDERLGGGRVPAPWGDAGFPGSPRGGETPDIPEPEVDDDDWDDDDWDDDDWDDDDWDDDDSDDDWEDDDSDDDAGRTRGDGGKLGEALGHDGGAPPRAPTPESAPHAPIPSESPRGAVPAEFVGAWENGTIDFEFWENYKPETWAGKHAIPTREAMIFRADGSAKFYRYEGLFLFYEELIDCEGTVTFGDGTFTFQCLRGRKRFYDTSQRVLKTDRALTSEELTMPKLAGTRGYRYLPANEPPAIEITVPTSAPYKWYKKSSGD